MYVTDLYVHVYVYMLQWQVEMRSGELAHHVAANSERQTEQTDKQRARKKQKKGRENQGNCKIKVKLKHLCW